MRRTLLLSSLLLAGAATTQAQEPILLRISGTPGQTNRYQSVVETFMSASAMAPQMAGMVTDTTLPFSRMTMFTSRTLLGTAGDTLSFQEIVDSAKSESPAVPMMGAMMGGAATAMRGQTTTTKMDGRGRIF